MAKTNHEAAGTPAAKGRLIPFRVPADEHAQIAELAEAEGRSMANFVRYMYRRGLEDFLQQRRQQGKASA